jgi:hypothetical protein
MDPLGQALFFCLLLSKMMFVSVQGSQICVNSFGLDEERDQRKNIEHKHVPYLYDFICASLKMTLYRSKNVGGT